MTAAAPRTRRSWFDIVYMLGVGIKGVDGVVELLSGLALLCLPAQVQSLLQVSAERFSPHRAAGIGPLTVARVVRGIAHADHLLSQHHTYVVVWLLAHGVTKIALVICLLRKWHRVYPWAMAVLLVLTGYQVWEVVQRPGIGSVALLVLNLLIIALVVREYVILRRESRGGEEEPVAAG